MVTQTDKTGLSWTEHSSVFDGNKEKRMRKKKVIVIEKCFTRRIYIVTYYKIIGKDLLYLQREHINTFL